MPHPWLLLSIVVPAGLVALPLGYVVVRSWQAGPAGVFAELLRPRTVELLGNTLTLTLSVTLCAAMIGTAAAWCTERCDLPGRGFWRIAASLPLALPAYVSSYAWSSLGPWLQGMAGAIVILTFYSVPLIYLPVAAALRGMDPNFEDVARSLGHGRWMSFFRVVLPQAGPALGGGALLVASHMLAEFGALAFLQVETFTTAIFQQYQLQFDNAAAALLSGVLMALCLPVVLAEMRLRRGRRLARISRGSARAPVPIPLGRWTPLVLLGFAGLTLLAFGVPFVTLGFWLWRGTSAGLGIATLLPALIGSLSFSLPGAALTAVLALPLVLASTRGRGRIAGFADRLPYLIHGLPGIVVALAVVSVSIRYVPALYQSLSVVFAAYAILCLPLAQSAIRASAELVPPELDDVARSLGKGPFRAFVLATLPGLLPGIRAALALSALVLMRELTATLLLAPAGMVTLATEFWSYTSDRAYAAAAPFAAVLVLVSGLPLFVFTLKSSLAPSEAQ